LAVWQLAPNSPRAKARWRDGGAKGDGVCVHDGGGFSCQFFLDLNQKVAKRKIFAIFFDKMFGNSIFCCNFAGEIQKQETQ